MTRRFYDAVGQFEKELPQNYDISSWLRDVLEYSMGHARKKGAYLHDGCEQAVLNVINNVRLLSLERFFEDSIDVPAEGFRTYAELFLRAYREFGHNASDYFVLKYSKALKAGLDPNDYFDFVSTAVNEGGRRFGAWYAYMLPDAYESGADPISFMEDASRVHSQGGIALLKPFVLGVPNLLKQGFTTNAIADMAEQAVSNADEKTAPWILRNMGSLAKLGYRPEDFLSDTIRLVEERGEKAALWFAYGFYGISALNENLDREARGLEYHTNDPELQRNVDKIKAERMTGIIKRRAALRPETFKDGYLDLLGTIGQNTATFYSLSVRIQKGSYPGLILPISGEYTYFTDITEATKRLKRQAPKKVFSSSMWFVPKIVSSPVDVAPILDDVCTCLFHHGEAETLSAIGYTYGIRRRGGHPDRLVTWEERNIGETTDASKLPTEDEYLALLKRVDRELTDLGF